MNCTTNCTAVSEGGGGGGAGAGLVLGAAVGGFLLLVVSLSVCYAKKWACFAVGTLYYLLYLLLSVSMYYINLHNKYLEKAEDRRIGGKKHALVALH